MQKIKRVLCRTLPGILKDEDINILGSVTNDSAEYEMVPKW